MTQLQLVWDPMEPTLERAKKLGNDLKKVFQILSDKKPHLVKDIAEQLHVGEASAQAQCRNLRKKPWFLNVQCKNLGNGLNYYILQDGFYQGNKK